MVVSGDQLIDPNKLNKVDNSSKSEVQDELNTNLNFYEEGASKNDDIEQAISWLDCIAELKHLGDYLKECMSFVDSVNNNQFPHPLNVLVSVADLAKDVNTKSSNLMEKAKKVIKKLESEYNKQEEIYKEETLPPRDPYERAHFKDLSDKQKQYLIDMGPYQPKLYSFPKNTAIPDGKQCTFSPRWFNEYPHLEYSIKADAAYCFVCSLFPSGLQRAMSDDNWTAIGVKAWHKMKSRGRQKEGKLTLHFSSYSHKAALQDYVIFSNPTGHIDIMLSREKRMASLDAEITRIKNSEAIEILLDVARTLSRQGLAFRGADNDSDGNFVQIVKLLGRHSKVMKWWLNTSVLRPYHVMYLSPSSQNEFIDLLAKEVQNQIIEGVNNSGMYSISADTTPDTSHKDRLAVVVRHVNENGHPVERLLDIKEAKDKTGLGIATSIIDSLNISGINTNELCFQSYDYASAMSGKLNGTQAHISNILKRDIPYVPCQAHRANTVLEHSCQASKPVADLFIILEELYVFFTSSTKRYDVLQDKLSLVESALQLKNLSKTRWTARADSLNAVWRAFDVIVKALEDIEDSSVKIPPKTRAQARGLLHHMLRFDFIMAMMFMKNIMHKTKIMTESLQSENLNLVDATAIIESTIKALERINNDTDNMDSEIQAAKQFAGSYDIDPTDDFNRHNRPRKLSLRADKNPETQAVLTLEHYWRQQFKLILDTLVSQYTDNLKVALETIKPLAGILTSCPKYDLNDIKEACKLFPPDKEVDALALEAELTIFFGMPETSTAKSAADIARCAFNMKHIFPLVSKVVDLLQTAPVTVAKDERTFSKLSLIKNFHRSCMTDDRLKSLMVLACEKDLTESINLKHLAKIWSKLKLRRI